MRIGGCRFSAAKGTHRFSIFPIFPRDFDQFSQFITAVLQRQRFGLAHLQRGLHRIARGTIILRQSWRTERRHKQRKEGKTAFHHVENISSPT
ncbi:MAG: hypothetical protein AAFO78_14685 [Pseudomonadota bacterium]